MVTGRYPYTYAYDWLREAGLVESRSEAAEWVHDRFPDEEERMSFILQMANQYCEHYESVKRLEEIKTRLLQSLRENFK